MIPSNLTEPYLVGIDKALSCGPPIERDLTGPKAAVPRGSHLHVPNGEVPSSFPRWAVINLKQSVSGIRLAEDVPSG